MYEYKKHTHYKQGTTTWYGNHVYCRNCVLEGTTHLDQVAKVQPQHQGIDPWLIGLLFLCWLYSVLGYILRLLSQMWMIWPFSVANHCHTGRVTESPAETIWARH